MSVSSKCIAWTSIVTVYHRAQWASFSPSFECYYYSFGMIIYRLNIDSIVGGCLTRTMPINGSHSCSMQPYNNTKTYSRTYVCVRTHIQTHVYIPCLQWITFDVPLNLRTVCQHIQYTYPMVNWQKPRKNCANRRIHLLKSNETNK